MAQKTLSLGLWSISLPPHPQKDWALWLNQAEHAHIAHSAKDEHSRRFAGGQAFTRYVLTQKLGFPADVFVARDDMGRPYVRLACSEAEHADHAEHGPLISRSYNDDRLYLLIAEAGLSGVTAIGVDVETIRSFADLPVGLDYICSEGERAWLNSLSPDQLIAAFYQLWTLKEAGLKALGTGFLNEPKDFVITCPLPPPTGQSHHQAGLSLASLRQGDVMMSLGILSLGLAGEGQYHIDLIGHEVAQTALKS